MSRTLDYRQINRRTRAPEGPVLDYQRLDELRIPEHYWEPVPPGERWIIVGGSASDELIIL